MQPCTEPPILIKIQRGAMEASKAFKLHVNHETLWAYLSSSTTRSEGCACGNTSMCDEPHAGFPRRATLLAPKGERPYTEVTTSGAAPTSPPEGVLRCILHVDLV